MKDATTKRVKAPSVYVTNADRYKIAKYLIENNYIIQDPTIPEKPFTIWRIIKSIALSELKNSNLELPNINVYHLNQCIDFYNEIAILTHKMPEPPPIQDTVEMDRLTAAIKQKELIIDEQRKIIEEFIKHFNSIKSICDVLAQRIKVPRKP